MKRQPSLLACLLLAASAATAQQQGNASVGQTRQAELNAWQTYRINGEQVSASFPIHPAMTTIEIYREETKQTLTNRMVGAYADGAVYAIYTFDNPTPRLSFEEFVARETEGRWADSRAIKIGRYTGKEYSSKKDDSVYTMQLFAVDDRLYKFTARGAAAEDAAFKQFFSSIALDGKEGIGVFDGPGGSFSQPSSEIILTGKDVDRRVQLVMKPEPRYTEEARQNLIVGTVILKVVFASTGSVTNIQTAHGLPYGLTEQSIAAAKKLKYIPAMKDGKYVSMWMQLEYTFSLY